MREMFAIPVNAPRALENLAFTHLGKLWRPSHNQPNSSQKPSRISLPKPLRISYWSQYPGNPSIIIGDGLAKALAIRENWKKNYYKRENRPPHTHARALTHTQSHWHSRKYYCTHKHRCSQKHISLYVGARTLKQRVQEDMHTHTNTHTESTDRYAHIQAKTHHESINIHNYNDDAHSTTHSKMIQKETLNHRRCMPSRWRIAETFIIYRQMINWIIIYHFGHFLAWWTYFFQV